MKITEYIKIVSELVKFEHTIFALPFAFTGALFGGSGRIDPRQIFFILMAMVGARTAGMAFNRLVDARIDAKNPRTQNRALPKKLLSYTAVTLLILISLALFFFAAYSLNAVCFKLSPLALFVVLIYSYTKRFTSLSHFFLGLVLAIAPAGGYLAVKPAFDPLLFALSGSVLLWTAGFDIIYACQDIDFDRKEKLYSLPALRGMNNALRISRLLHALTIVGLILTGRLAGAGAWFYLSTAICTALLVYEHSLIGGGDLEKIDMAFFNVNGYVAMIIFAGTLLNYHLPSW